MKKYLVGLMILMGGMMNGVMDTLDFHYGNSAFRRIGNEQFWSPEISWKNKYKDWDGGDRRQKYGVATPWLTWTTDAWHLSKFFMLTFFAIAVSISIERTVKRRLVAFFVFRLLFSIGFSSIWEFS